MADLTVVEGGSLFVTASFTDRNGDAVTPDSVTWSLCDGNGSIINEREDESVTPDEEVTFLVSGDDFPWVGSYPAEIYFLYLLVKSVYDEVDEDDVPQNQEQRIAVTNARCIG